MLGTQLYHRLVAAENLLYPIKSAGYWGTVPVSLANTQPTLRGTWVFRDPNSTQGQPQSSLIVVQIDWTDDGEGSYDKTNTKFYRPEPGRVGAKVNMDVNLLELGE